MKLDEMPLVNVARDPLGRLSACFILETTKREFRRLRQDPSWGELRVRLDASEEDLADILVLTQVVDEISAAYPHVYFWVKALDPPGPVAPECVTFEKVRARLGGTVVVPLETAILPDSNGGFRRISEGIGSSFLAAPPRDRWPDLIAGMVVPRYHFSTVAFFARDPVDIERVNDRIRGISEVTEFTRAMDAWFAVSFLEDMDEGHCILTTTDEDFGRRVLSGRRLDWRAYLDKL